jgi:hypothetical protein
MGGSQQQSRSVARVHAGQRGRKRPWATPIADVCKKSASDLIVCASQDRACLYRCLNA